MEVAWRLTSHRNLRDWAPCPNLRQLDHSSGEGHLLVLLPELYQHGHTAFSFKFLSMIVSWRFMMIKIFIPPKSIPRHIIRTHYIFLPYRLSGSWLTSNFIHIEWLCLLYIAKKSDTFYAALNNQSVSKICYMKYIWNILLSHCMDGVYQIVSR